MPTRFTAVAGDDTESLRPVRIWIVAVTLGSLTMASVVALLVWDAFPSYSRRGHTSSLEPRP